MNSSIYYISKGDLEFVRESLLRKQRTNYGKDFLFYPEVTLLCGYDFIETVIMMKNREDSLIGKLISIMIDNVELLETGVFRFPIVFFERNIMREIFCSSIALRKFLVYGIIGKFHMIKISERIVDYFNQKEKEESSDESTIEISVDGSQEENKMNGEVGYASNLSDCVVCENLVNGGNSKCDDHKKGIRTDGNDVDLKETEQEVIELISQTQCVIEEMERGSEISLSNIEEVEHQLDVLDFELQMEIAEGDVGVINEAHVDYLNNEIIYVPSHKTRMKDETKTGLGTLRKMASSYVYMKRTRQIDFDLMGAKIQESINKQEISYEDAMVLKFVSKERQNSNQIARKINVYLSGVYWTNKIVEVHLELLFLKKFVLRTKSGTDIFYYIV